MLHFGEFCLAEEEQRQLELSERIGHVQEQDLHLFFLCGTPTQESLHHRTKEYPIFYENLKNCSSSTGKTVVI